MVKLKEETTFLATTALETFWDKNAKKGVFLGEWCKLYDRKKEYEKLSFDTMEYIWIDKQHIDSGIKYCEEIYQEILKALIIILNKHHKIEKDYTYWDTLLKPWLIDYIQIMYDKYKHIELTKKRHKNIYTYTLAEESYQFLNTSKEFKPNVIKMDEYNLQLYSQIIKFLNIAHSDIDYQAESIVKKIEIKSSNREKILRIISTILNKIFSKKMVLIAGPNFKHGGINKTIKLWIKSKFLIVFNDFEYDISIKTIINLKIRKSIFNINTQDRNFKNLIFNTLIYNFPIVYLEGYLEFSKIVDKIKIPIPNIIFSSQLIHANEIFKFYVADNYFNFKKCYKQHGGGYGIDLKNMQEEVEKNFSDIYFSYGWSEKGVRPLADPIINTYDIKDNGSINLVLNNMSRYFYRFTYQPESTKGLMSIENTQIFLKTLKQCNKVSVRLYPYHYKLNTKQRLLDVNKNIIFDSNTNYYKKLLSARINIFSHLFTGYLESMSNNKPTIIIIPKGVYFFRESAKSHIKKLREVKILFDNPIEASTYVDKIYDDIDTWWLSEKVQKVRKEFCYNYARTSKNWADEWINVFNRVLDEK